MTPQPITVDVNVLVAAVTGGNDTFHSWPSPPPVRGNLAANVVGILNDGREFSLWLSEHILVNVVRVLAASAPTGYGWAVEQAREYASVLVEMAEAGDGGVVEPKEVVTDRPDYEDNRILECAAATSSVLIISDDTDLLSLSPWRGTPIVTSRDFVNRTDAMRRKRR
ncbi:MAG TPA: PIN domain-containing protein [Acidimicrobiales bacterium]|nr:PIN domain-containing protein [Acidimicrobiales bacterium]